MSKNEQAACGCMCSRALDPLAREVVVVDEGCRVRVWIGTNASQGRLAALLAGLGIEARMEPRPDPLRLSGGSGFCLWIDNLTAKEALDILTGSRL